MSRLTKPTTKPRVDRPDLERSISFYPLSIDQIADDLMKIRPTPRPTKVKAKSTRRKKKTTKR